MLSSRQPRPLLMLSGLAVPPTFVDTPPTLWQSLCHHTINKGE